MKKGFCILLLVIPFLGFSQINDFKIKEISVIDPIVNMIDGGTANNLYLKSKDWFKYVDKEAQIKALEPDDFMRFGKTVYKFTYIELLGNRYYDNVYLLMRIDFKEGKYRMTLEDYYIQSATGTIDRPKRKLDDYKADDKLDKNGKLKEFEKSSYDRESTSLIKEINKLNKSLYDYLSDKTNEKNDDW